jgi:chorismate mutase/prephenate dehydratase
MDEKDPLKGMRSEIDEVDAQIMRLFERRMDISESVAEAKVASNIAVTDTAREMRKVEAFSASAKEKNRLAASSLMRTLISLSKMRQESFLGLGDPVVIPEPGAFKAEGQAVAYQGLPGAWSEEAAASLFPGAEYRQLEYFDDVFACVQGRGADYGVVPIENTQTGAIGEVYDLLRRHSCYIVGEARIPVRQCLIAQKGAKLSDIREVFSHPEAFGQCRRFLKNKNWDLTTARNTAVAAQAVAQKGEIRAAAIASKRAASFYGLEVLEDGIVDDPSNATRFIAISPEPIFDEKSDAVSITFSTEHRSGALCSVLDAFMLEGINLSRIESRPASGGRYRFFADLECSLHDESAKQALRMAAHSASYFEILGCYKADR